MRPLLTEEEKERKRKGRKDEKERKKAAELQKALFEQDKGGLFPKDAEITFDLVVKKFHEVIANRGKKGTDKFEQISMINELKTVATTNDLGCGLITKISFNLVAAGFDLNNNIFDSMKLDHWKQVLKYMDELLDYLIENISTVSVAIDYTDDQEVLKEAPFMVSGCPLTFCDRVATEFTKILQDSDCHSTDYVDKLRFEPLLYNLVIKCQGYLEKSKANSDLLCKCYLSRIELLYYKFDKMSTTAYLETDEGKAAVLANPDPGPNSLKLIDELCKYIYTSDKKNWIRTRAVLCQIFNLALHDKWYQARDLMLMSHLQESIHFADVETQLLYNRTLVQLGLCAFRHGNIRAAHDALLDIQSSGRKKEQELLAQGLVTRQQEKTPEQEKIEKRRQQAFHTHINLDLLECTYLVSAMLLEIPYMASHEADTKRRMISKSFHNQLKQSERQPLPGPPENMHEHVIAASKAMRMGDWHACYNFIVNKKMNARVWDLFPTPEVVKQILKRKIQEESLRAYLFTFANKLSTISLDNLAKQYELEEQTVHSIISKLVITEELAASWDEPSNCIVTHPSDPSSVQKLCNHLSEKLNHLVENNERLLEAMGNKNLQFMFQGRDHKGGNQGDNRDRKQNRGMRNQNMN
jgi:translation initiation factor 3 subunit C